MASAVVIHILAALSALASVSAVPSATDPYKVVFHLENLERGKNGSVIVMVHPAWAPLAAARFAELVEQHFFDGSRFFRVVVGSLAQFGISTDAKVNADWKGRTIQDDPSVIGVHNIRGTLSFFTDGDKDDRNTQIIFNVKDNDLLDDRGYVPFAEVLEGIFFIDRIYNKYGGAHKAPDQSKLANEGDEYAEKSFPLLSKIRSVEILEPTVAQAEVPAAEGTSFLTLLVIAASVSIVIGLFGAGWHAMVSNQVAPTSI